MKIIQCPEIFFRCDLFLLAAISKGLVQEQGWVGLNPELVANQTSVDIDHPTILHRVQPTIFRISSKLLRTRLPRPAWKWLV